MFSDKLPAPLCSGFMNVTDLSHPSYSPEFAPLHFLLYELDTLEHDP